MVRDTVVVLSHLRWNFVYQRPQQLMERCARTNRVVFFEEPLCDTRAPALELTHASDGVLLAVPRLPPGLAIEEAEAAQRKMLDRLLYQLEEPRPILWYYTPMAIAFTQHVKAIAVVYDCMDELSLFQGAPPELAAREALLLREADVVFTGGQSLYEHKRATSGRKNIYPFPSSVDVPHFAQARAPQVDPPDQAELPHPRIGFFGMIDERMDLDLLDALSRARPDLQLVMIGPVVKIDPQSLPRRANLHWLGGKSYAALPQYLAGWDAAMLPFARNASTRFISPTETPAYLAAGMPVVSTSITDVIKPYGCEGLAWIADAPEDFALAIDAALAADRPAQLAHADLFLMDRSWDLTWAAMWQHVERATMARPSLATLSGAGGAAHVHRAPEKP